jgi:hypothetical protein
MCTGYGMEKDEVEQFVAQRAWIVHASLRLKVSGEAVPTNFNAYTMRKQRLTTVLITKKGSAISLGRRKTKASSRWIELMLSRANSTLITRPSTHSLMN